MNNARAAGKAAQRGEFRALVKEAEGLPTLDSACSLFEGSEAFDADRSHRRRGNPAKEGLEPAKDYSAPQADRLLRFYVDDILRAHIAAGKASVRSQRASTLGSQRLSLDSEGSQLGEQQKILI